MDMYRASFHRPRDLLTYHNFLPRRRIETEGEKLLLPAMLTRILLTRSSQAPQALTCTGRLFHAFRSVESTMGEKRGVGKALSSTSTPMNASEEATAAKPLHPKLVEIPSLPLFGSMLPFHSGFRIDPADANGTFRKLGETHGSFYSLGLPGVGKGWDGTLYVTGDPDQMMKVLRQEGSYPAGAAENQWVLKEWFRSRNFKTAAMYER